MPTGICRLCDNEGELRESHVIPAFAYRWMRETSGTGHIRLGTAPNRRAPDGHKRYLLCSDCETKFSQWETYFATLIFHPYSSGTASRFRYGPYLLKFCISVSWRVLRFYREETDFQDYPSQLVELMDEAERVWKDALLDKKPNPGVYEQHILPLDAIGKHTYSSMPANINRYLMRVIDMDVVRSQNVGFVYSKLGRFIILGFFKLDAPKEWRGTKVLGHEGFIEPRNYRLPAQFADCIFSKARGLAELNARISPRQKAKIDATFRKNIDNVIGSDALTAMTEDIRLFGREAFLVDDNDQTDR